MTDFDTRFAARRAFLRQSTALGVVGMLGGCATLGLGRRGADKDASAKGGAGKSGPGRLAFRDAPPLAPIDARPERIMNITVCLRPFRAAGPRLDAETVGDKLVVHNYGHGGSGWSLSWGSGVIAVRRALQGGARDVAVIGCGALGLTAATLAQRAGAQVTIYAKERMPDVRSARATGIWSPDSRIALTSAVDSGFPALWEQMARTSFRMHQRYLGLADGPVEWEDRYTCFDAPPTAGEDDPLGFASYGSRIRDLTPPSVALTPEQHPFPVPVVRKTSTPVYNITEYGRVLMNDFLLAGGRIETREFHAPSELAQLPQKVVINCTGYGARALWKDESIVPVRGQLAWLIPQPEVAYGLYYKGVGVVSRRDGLIVQQTGGSDSYGYNDATEEPDRAEAEAAVKAIAPLFRGRSAARA